MFSVMKKAVWVLVILILNGCRSGSQQVDLRQYFADVDTVVIQELEPERESTPVALTTVNSATDIDAILKGFRLQNRCEPDRDMSSLTLFFYRNDSLIGKVSLYGGFFTVFDFEDEKSGGSFEYSERGQGARATARY